jgi:hypothetical protein
MVRKIGAINGTLYLNGINKLYTAFFLHILCHLDTIRYRSSSRNAAERLYVSRKAVKKKIVPYFLGFRPIWIKSIKLYVYKKKSIA